jgi:hypothetical protein
MKTIDERISRLEKKTGYVKGRVPGTQISRVLTVWGIEWCLSIGLMQDRKRFFSGKTIEECLKKAEKELI